MTVGILYKGRPLCFSVARAYVESRWLAFLAYTFDTVIKFVNFWQYAIHNILILYMPLIYHYPG